MTDKIVCPKCGKSNWLATSTGMMCKECKNILVSDTPVLKTK